MANADGNNSDTGSQEDVLFAEALISSISESTETQSNTISKTKLKTDEKVLARVTDGIYRLPGSAIRELISNAYDADAENVIIETDVPRFESMTIRDDGNGMSVDTLVDLTSHIGGSSKRNDRGIKLGVASNDNPSLSPKKNRKLIGKIGIGLFSVAQLTRNFEIVTKQTGDNYYLKASVKLYNYSDEYVRDKEHEDAEKKEERGAGFETGDVYIWTEPTDNIEAHGTDIILKDIKKSARDILQSVDIWGQEAVETTNDPSSSDEANINENFLDTSKLEKPTFHVGCLSGKDGYEFFDTKTDRKPSLPWDDNDPEDIKFSKLYEAVLSLTKNTVSPKLNIVLDHYFNMLWTMGLSVPLDYINGHPFALTLKDIPDCYAISNRPKGQVVEVEHESETIGVNEILSLPTDITPLDFNVVIDGIKLYRPLKFTDLPESRAAVKKPILFIGSYSPNLSSLGVHDSGGELAFDAYILWSPKVIPRDHNGVLIRLNNASGIMFDETFMKHQVAEHTIKSQLTIEVFINKGLDSALNIDRESFNISHPHYQIVMRWLHQALRQVINKYKAIKREKTKSQQEKGQTQLIQNLASLVNESMEKRGIDSNEKPELFITEDAESVPSQDSFNVTKSDFLEATNLSKQAYQKSNKVEAKTEALLQIVDSYGLLEGLSPEKQQSLITDILKIISTEG